MDGIITEADRKLCESLERYKAEYLRLADLQQAIYDESMDRLKSLGFDDGDMETIDAVTEYFDNNREWTADELLESLRYGSWPAILN